MTRDDKIINEQQAEIKRQRGEIRKGNEYCGELFRENSRQRKAIEGALEWANFNGKIPPTFAAYMKQTLEESE